MTTRKIKISESCISTINNECTLPNDIEIDKSTLKKWKAIHCDNSIEPVKKMVCTSLMRSIEKNDETVVTLSEQCILYFLCKIDVVFRIIN